jgi:hypothetical protein
LRDCSGQVHPDRVLQILSERVVSPIPRDLAEDRRLDQVLESAENPIKESERARNIWQQNRVNPLPSTKKQLKKARKIKRLQEAGKKQEAEQVERVQRIRATIIGNLSKESDLRPYELKYIQVTKYIIGSVVTPVTSGSAGDKSGSTKC